MLKSGGAVAGRNGVAAGDKCGATCPLRRGDICFGIVDSGEMEHDGATRRRGPNELRGSLRSGLFESDGSGPREGGAASNRLSSQYGDMGSVIRSERGTTNGDGGCPM